MGRQIQVASTQIDRIELFRFIDSIAPIRVFKSSAASIEDLWIEDWHTTKPTTDKLPDWPERFNIWPQDFEWSPVYGQTGSPDCKPECAGQFYVLNLGQAPILEFTSSILEKNTSGRIYWARNFSAPDGLLYNENAFSKLTDKIWHWIRNSGKRLPNSQTHSPYFLPDAWNRFGVHMHSK